MKIFPIGTVSNGSSSGTIDGISYSMFEPNVTCHSNKVHTILVTQFENQSLLTRKKALPFLTITYEYADIFNREYRQIEHFVDDVEDALSSFFVVDFSKGLTPSSITLSSGDWVVAIDNTRLYSSTANQKANRAFIWDGINWKEGQIASVSTNTSITVDIDANNYGALSLADAQTNGMVYPLYEVYLTQNALQNFKSTKFIHADINNSEDGGYMKTGKITFVTKYKV